MRSRETGPGPRPDPEVSRTPQMVKLPIRKDPPRQGQGPEDSAEASALQHVTCRKASPALLAATAQCREVAACSAEDPLGLTEEEENLPPTGPGGSQPVPVPAGASEHTWDTGWGGGRGAPSGDGSTGWQGPRELTAHTGGMAPGRRRATAPTT